MFDMRVKWIWSIFISFRTRWTDASDSEDEIEYFVSLGETKLFRGKLHDVFTFSKVYLYAKVERILFL